tara:strand:+ start:865 stop:1413 length:549 start_codon:yes stop_codon:yes gene_type:complete
MNTLTKETARSLAKVINSRLSTCYNDDLVAILGTGRESNNEQAVQSWLMSRFANIEVGQKGSLMEYAFEVLTQHLDDIRLEVAIGVITELPLQPSFIPARALTERELRCIARSIYLLVLGQGSRDYLDALVELVLGGDGNTIDKIAAWITSQIGAYTYFPSELTLLIAQNMMQKLRQSSEFC